MPVFHFDCQTEDGTAKIGGDFPAEDAAEAWSIVKVMIWIEGRWRCRVRRGRNWLKSRTLVCGETLKRHWTKE